MSWNGSGFDLPVLHYRALIHQLSTPRYWDTGHFDRESKWDNYIGRYQFRHTDLMDVLALYQARAYAPLHEMALAMLGLPPASWAWDGSGRWPKPSVPARSRAEIRAHRAKPLGRAPHSI